MVIYIYMYVCMYVIMYSYIQSGKPKAKNLQ